MKVLNQQRGFTALLALVFVLLLCMTFMFVFTPNNSHAFANEADSATTEQSDLIKDKPIDISLSKSQNSVVKYACEYEGNHIISVSNLAVNVVGIEEENSNGELKFKAIGNNIYIVSLQYGFNYLIELQSSTNQSTKIAISPETSAFNWIVNDEKITANQAIKLDRGNSYLIDFIVNDMASYSFSPATIGNQNYEMKGNTLSIGDDCKVEGSTITLFSDIPYIETQYITIIPAFNNKIDIVSSFDTGDARGLLWKYQNGITQITYQIEHANNIFTKTIDSINEKPISSFEHGKVYELDVADDLLTMTDTLDKAKVSITSATMSATNSKVVDFDVESSSAIVNTRLSWVGSGTSSSPYQVSSISHFNDISDKDDSGVYFKQTVNLDFNNTYTTRNVKFEGIYNGNNKNITDIRLTRSDPTNVGALFDRNQGTIKGINELEVYMDFDTIFYAGGMVGNNLSDGIIYTPNNFSPTIRVNNANEYLGAIVGGVAGNNSGTIMVKGIIEVDIISNGAVGGIAGHNAGLITSYVESGWNFWDLLLNIKTVEGSITWNYLTSSPSDSLMWDVGGIAAVNSGSTGLEGITYLLCDVDINLDSESVSSTIKPKAGGYIGRQNGNCLSPTLIGYGGDYTSNLTTDQSVYVNFTSSPYIGLVE